MKIKIDGPSKIQKIPTTIKDKIGRGLTGLKNFLPKRLPLVLNFAKGEKKFLISLVLLLVIVLVPWISEYSVNQQIYVEIQKYSAPLDPIKAGELATGFAPYTPGIEENAEDVALFYMLRGDNFTLSQQLSINANKQIEGPTRAEATYTVGGGETIMQIAEKFNLHVATILDANGIKPEDAKKIKPGTVLKVPSSDTSTSSDWLAAIKNAEDAEKAREQKLAEEQKKKQSTLAKKFAATTKYTSPSGYNSVDNSDLAMPINSRGTSQGFGRGHTGVDLMADIGTPVMAAASGRVIITSSGWSGGYGNQIVIDHGGGRATRYAHLSSFAVGVGNTVSRGQVIAYSGSTGRSTGPHLHFELIINGRPVAPF